MPQTGNDTAGKGSDDEMFAEEAEHPASLPAKVDHLLNLGIWDTPRKDWLTFPTSQ